MGGELFPVLLTCSRGEKGTREGGSGKAGAARDVHAGDKPIPTSCGLRWESDLWMRRVRGRVPVSPRRPTILAPDGRAKVAAAPPPLLFGSPAGEARAFCGRRALARQTILEVVRGRDRDDSEAQRRDAPTGTGKTTAHTDTYHGRFVKLVRKEQVVEVVEFETTDPALRGEMTITISLADADGGTDVLAVHDGLPRGLSTADNEAGWRSSLAKLAALAEAARPRAT